MIILARNLRSTCKCLSFGWLYYCHRLNSMYCPRAHKLLPSLHQYSQIAQYDLFTHRHKYSRPYTDKLPETWSIIYKDPSIKYFRLISRFKVYQILFMCGLCYPLYGWYVEELISKTTFVSAIGGCVGTSLVFAIFSYFSTKVIGQLAVNESESAIRLSRLTFYGSRVDDVFGCTAVVPWSDDSTQENFGNLYQRLYIDINGNKISFVYTIKHGKIIDKEKFATVLGIPID